jgi:hypothetical protein
VFTARLDRDVGTRQLRASRDALDAVHEELRRLRRQEARAGRSDYSTTQLYIDLAGETFREEADRLEDRLFAGAGKGLGKSD